MTASRIKQELIDNYQLGLPAFVWGSPGIGKSAIIYDTTKHLGIGFVDLRVSNMDPVDLSGLPSIDKETKLTTWNIPAM